MILEHGLVGRNVPLKRVLEVVDHGDAWNKIVEFGSNNTANITLDGIMAIHHDLMKHTLKDSAGRSRESPVMITDVCLLFPQPDELEDGLFPKFIEFIRDFAQEVNKRKLPRFRSPVDDDFPLPNSPYHPVVMASLAHYLLVRIHPFEDGNGRMGR
eukprot:GEZU01023194.1.p1 GENE.GEZU01023194.1~~GEZU01023194.1.p1  ORF type:complete len:156 (-),score=15.68 GEZU01023194.1:1109-1576(-)